MTVILCFLVGSNQSVFAESSPSVSFAPGVAVQVFGGQTKNEAMNCDLLVNKTWPYPSAQVSPLCDDAATSCIRYSLMLKTVGKAQGTRKQELSRDIPTSRRDVEMKLMGCVQAIEATISGNRTLTDVAGYGK